MTQRDLVGSAMERPFFCGPDDRSLFGVWTAPDHDGDTAAVLLSGGAHTPSTSRNRLWVTIARRLAANGIHAIRFDYHGVGESTGWCEGYRFDRPFTQDLAQIVDQVRACGIEKIAFVGACFGARTALSYVPELDNVEALVLFAPPSHEFEMGVELGVGGYLKKAATLDALKGLFDKRRRYTYRRIVTTKARVVANRWSRRTTSATGQDAGVSPHFLRFMREALERRVPTLVVFGDQDEFRDQWDRAIKGRLGEMVSAAGDSVSVEIVEGGEVHAFTKLDVQDAVADLVVDWLPQHLRTRATDRV